MSQDLFDQLLDANRDHASGFVSPGGSRPTRQLTVVTCMDVRIDPLGALGLGLGEAHVLRNAGGRVTDDVLRSLALSVHALGSRSVVLMQHTGCGLAGVTNDDLQKATGAQLEFLAIDDHERRLTEDVDRLLSTDFLEPVEAVAGWLYDVDRGAITEVVRRRRG